jgi:hypothetical protein
VQERLEASPLGRQLISAALVVVLLSIVAWNLPSSALRQRTLPLTRRVLVPLGLDQAWNVFAPDPRRQVVSQAARITYDDGSTAMWQRPTGDQVVGEYRFYRWQKLMESEIADAHQSDLWQPFAEWVARTHARAGRRVTKVELLRRWYDLSPAGRDQGRPPRHEYLYFTWEPSP